MGKRPRRRAAGVDADTVRELALSLPEVEERPSYGTPGFRVRKGKLFARLHPEGDRILRIDPDERELLVEADPGTFYVTDHYRNAPFMLVRLSAVRRSELPELLESAWRLAAPRRLLGRA